MPITLTIISLLITIIATQLKRKDNIIVQPSQMNNKYKLLLLNEIKRVKNAANA